jgi:hypothetical protein
MPRRVFTNLEDDASRRLAFRRFIQVSKEYGRWGLLHPGVHL